MGKEFYFAWESVYMVWFQHLGQGTFLQTVLTVLNNIFSFFGEEYIAIVLMGMIYWCFDKEKGRRIGLAVIAVNISNGMIKNVFRRLRPYQCLDNVELLRDVDGFSFPSGHSANSAALYPSLAYEHKNMKWLRPLAVIIPILVALSRNYLGAHWPTDVLFGLLQGLLIMVLIEFLHKVIKNKYILYGIVVLACLPGIFYCTTDDYFTSLGLLFGMVAATWFEEKYVNFEMTSNWKLVILRTLGGGVIYGALNPVLKLLIGHIFEDGTPGSFLMRVIRYTVVVFVMLAVYPLIFRLEKKFIKEKAAA